MKKNPFSLNFRCEPGKVEQLEENIQRIIAPNASPMTFTGTNTYLVGKEKLAVIDPGPKDLLHLHSILSAVKPNQKITHTLITAALMKVPGQLPFQYQQQFSTS